MSGLFDPKSDRVALVPHDLTSFSDRAVEEARVLVPRSQLHVLHVLPRVDLTTPGVVWSRDEDEPRRQHAMQAMQAKFQGTDAGSAVLHVRIGDPATRIVELAKEIAATVIIIPCHGRKGMERMLLGSVSEHVVRFAPCPVLVLPASLSAPKQESKQTSPELDLSPDEQLESIAIALIDRAGATPMHLSAARIGLPVGSDERWWDRMLEARLAESGVEFVDLDFTSIPRSRAEILDTRFEQD